MAGIKVGLISPFSALTNRSTEAANLSTEDARSTRCQPPRKAEAIVPPASSREKDGLHTGPLLEGQHQTNQQQDDRQHLANRRHQPKPLGDAFAVSQMGIEVLFF